MFERRSQQPDHLDPLMHPSRRNLSLITPERRRVAGQMGSPELFVILLVPGNKDVRVCPYAFFSVSR